MSTYANDLPGNLVLESEEQIKAYINPTRLKILEILSSERQSVSGVARQFKIHPANLTHHFKILEKSGLITLVEKRDTGRNVEKLYRAVAYHFTIGGEPSSRSKQVVALTFLRDSLDAAIHTIQHQPEEQDVLGVIKTIHIDDVHLEEFARRLLELADEFGESNQESGKVYSLALGLYPGDEPGKSQKEIRLIDKRE